MKAFSALCSLVAVASIVASASAQVTFSNLAPITINDNAAATPYPSTIGIVGGPATISNIAVKINNISHTFTGDINLLLVGPGGQRVLLLANAGGGNNLVGDTLTFVIDGPTIPYSGVVPAFTGAWGPSSYFDTPTMQAPAPGGPYGNDLGVFVGTTSNGLWALYVNDDVGIDFGSIAGGWSLTFNDPNYGTSGFGTSSALTYQGKLTNGATPVNGNVDLQFTFWTSSVTGNQLFPSVSKFNVPVSEGLFTTRIDAGSMFFDNKELFMEIAVRNPAGSGVFTTLAGRQRVTPAPAAQWAIKADSAVKVPKLTSPDGSIAAVNVDASGNVLIGGATPFGAANFVLNGTQGTAAGNYGGMYIRTPHADGLPFYGYSTSSATCWTYLDPAQSMWRHNWGVNLSSAGNMGIGSDPVPGFRLAVNGALRCIGLTNASSIRYKKDVEPIAGVLDRFNELRPVTYVWNDTAPESVRGQKTTGLIAEEVYRLFPEAISLDAQGRPDGIDYSRVTAISIQAIKELQTKQTAKDAEIAALKARLEAIEKAIAK